MEQLKGIEKLLSDKYVKVLREKVKTDYLDDSFLEKDEGFKALMTRLEAENGNDYFFYARLLLVSILIEHMRH